MGALPKRRISKARRDRRRGADRLTVPSFSTCPKCGTVKLPHFKCPNCGHYGKLEKVTASPKEKVEARPEKKVKKPTKK